MADNDNLNPEQNPPLPSGRKNNTWLVRLACYNTNDLTTEFLNSEFPV